MANSTLKGTAMPFAGWRAGAPAYFETDCGSGRRQYVGSMIEVENGKLAFKFNRDRGETGTLTEDDAVLLRRASSREHFPRRRIKPRALPSTTHQDESASSR